MIAESEKSQAILDPLPDNRRAGACVPVRGELLHDSRGISESGRRAASLNRGGKSQGRQQGTRGGSVSAALSHILGVGRRGAGVGCNVPCRRADPLDPQLYRQRADVAVSAGRLDDAAIALVEGTFVTGDKSLRQALVELYRNAMDPKSCVLIAGPAGPAINPGCPAVHAHVCAASAGVIRTLAAANNTNWRRPESGCLCSNSAVPRAAGPGASLSSVCFDERQIHHVLRDEPGL